IQALRAVDEGFRPDAVLCDYQLANHRTGAQALFAVREVLRLAGQSEVVTLLITGDMASPELEALAAKGIPVLHKPVAPARLRRTLESLWQKSGVVADQVAGSNLIAGAGRHDAVMLPDRRGAVGPGQQDAAALDGHECVPRGLSP
ncbi:MAG TPA: hybrid sensor histidine kinase/response regulator, partial [Paraburkholderia sp.]|nr:hybrid sensor histidine kinase/response regulator [Paraburkholderia sp.]